MVLAQRVGSGLAEGLGELTWSVSFRDDVGSLRVTLYVVFTIGCCFEPLCGSGSGSLVRGRF